MATGAEFTPDSSWSFPSAPAFTPSTSNAVVISHNLRDPTEQDVSQRMLQLGRSMNIIGPKLISRERFEAEVLGRGAKFEVFGHKLPADRENQDGMLWEGIDVRRLAFKRGRTPLKKPEELNDPSSSWVAVVSESQESVGDMRTDHKKAKQLEQVAAVVREMKALARPTLRKHHNIVKLFAWGFDMDDFSSLSLMTPILVEERAWGTFSELLRAERLSAAERFNLCHDALQGLVALHEEGLYHGDINPKNMLVFQEEENIVAKISDFSHSGLIPQEAGDMIWYQGTKGWQAPEVEDTLPTSKADILALEAYSFGLVLWSALGLKGISPLANVPAEASSLPKFAYRCIESYSIPLEIKNIATPIVPRLLHHDPKTRFWLSREILEDKVPMPGRRLVLQTVAPSNLSMDDSFKQLDHFLRGRAGGNAEGDGAQETKNAATLESAFSYSNPFLRLMMEEAYIRDIAWRLGNLPQVPQLPTYNIPAYKPDPDSRGLLYMRQAAMAGDVRAQALYELLARGANSLSGPTAAPDTLQQWTYDAIATGFTLKSQPTTTVSPATRMAQSQFRENSSFNSYLYISNDPIKTAQSFRIDLDPLREYLCTPRFEQSIGKLQTEGPDGNSLLHYAVLAGHIEVVDKIIASHAARTWGLNTTNYRDETALLFACRGGNAEIAKALLNGGAMAGSRDGNVSPLHWLFTMPVYEMSNVCDLLLSQRARLNAIAPETPMFHFPFYMPEGTPLTWAVASGSLSAVEVLTKAIVNHNDLSVEEKVSCFVGAVKIAMIRHEADMMKVMVENTSSKGISLASVASEGFNWSVIDVPEDSQDIPVSATPLMGSWEDALIRTLRHGPAVEIEKNLNRILGYINSLQGSRISEGEADTGTTLAANFMYLRQVIIQQDSQSALRLLQRYGSTYSKSNLGEALFINIQYNWCLASSPRFPVFMDIFRGLISAGADVNSQNPLPGGLGNTLMHIVVRKYSEQSSSRGIKEVRDLVLLLLKVLQSCGANINMKNAVGMTVMDYALHNNRNYNLDEELVDMLHRWGSRSTFRLLPMRVEERIGDWGSRELEWRKPERERVDVRQRGDGNLAPLWNEIERAAERGVDEDDEDEPGRFYNSREEQEEDDDWDDGSSDGTACNDGRDDISILSQAPTLA
ncbi:hypothetical protein ABW19_dt0206468 [Dactylella cylindrospora]|nr:hypothetical protein ABW19_dt0206468 [Dactylella cylindrospora]